MTWQSQTLSFSQEAETVEFASSLAEHLKTGDTVLLNGDIGAGKSFLCRAIIRHLVQDVHDIPSPTFTLVQTYDADETEIWHCDLYRLTSADDVVELGLSDAFDVAICLVEWPDRLGDDAPVSSLTLHMQAHANHHSIYATATDVKWKNRIGHFFDE